MSKRLVVLLETVIAETATSFTAVAIDEGDMQVSFNDQYFLPEGEEIVLAAENEIMIETQNGWRKFYTPKGTVIKGPCVYANIKHTSRSVVDKKNTKMRNEMMWFSAFFSIVAMVSFILGAVGLGWFAFTCGLLIIAVISMSRGALVNEEKEHKIELQNAERFLRKEPIPF